MKKHLIIAAACLASVGAAYGQGQGAVTFENYNGGSLNAPVTFNVNPALVPAGKAGETVGSTFDAELAFFIGTTTVPSQLTLIPSSITAFLGVDGGNGPLTGAGYFQDGVNVPIPGVNSAASASAITFQVLVWDTRTGASYATATLTGASTLWTQSVGGAGPVPAPPVGDFGSNLHPFTVQTIVPEPGSLALAGLGAAGLLLFRRRK
jgi:hypothetical protein